MNRAVLCLGEFNVAVLALLWIIAGPARPANAGDFSPAAAKAQAPFGGTFSDGTATLKLVMESDGKYSGTISLRGQSFPAKASAVGNAMKGTFLANGHEFGFTADASDGQIVFVSGGHQYTLMRPGGANAGASDHPDAPAGSAKFTDAPALDAQQFAILASTDSGGHTIYRVVGKTDSIESLIGSLIDPLSKVFDTRPLMSGGYIDTKTKRTGGCTFDVKAHGRAMRGWVFAGINNAGLGIASIIYGPANMSKQELAQLLAALPARPKMSRHEFPDRSGSVDLPNGWTTKSESLADLPLVISGPAGQTIVQGGHMLIATPDGSLATLTMKNYQMRVERYKQMVRISRQLGRPVPAAMNPGPPPDLERDMPQFIFCRYCSTPQEIIQNLYPVLERKLKQKNLPWFEVARIFTIAPLPAQIGGTAFGVYNLNDRHEGDRVIKMRNLQRLEIMPVGPTGEWSYWINGMAAPDATFNQDILVMNEIVRSIQVNGDVVSQKIDARAAAASKLLHDQFEAFQETMRKNHEQFEQNQRETFDRNQAAIAAQQKAVHDSSSDMIEYCLGVRDVYDTASGKMLSVDLFNSRAITQGLNDAANDPGRFVQISLRFER